jgi:DNA repair exonuclease SbcCD ATPase subunit
MPDKPKPKRPRSSRSSTDVLRGDIKRLDQRLAQLEDLLETAKAGAGRSGGAAREQLEQLAERLRTSPAALKTSLEELARAVADSRKTVEEEIGRLTRGFRAGVKAGREAYRSRPR